VDLFHSLDFTLLHLVLSSKSGSLIGINFLGLVSEAALRDGQNWLLFAVALLLVLILVVQAGETLLFLADTLLFDLSFDQGDGVIVEVLRFTPDAIHEVLFIASAELSLLKSLVNPTLHARELLKQLDLSLKDNLLVRSLLLGPSLSNREVEEKLVTANRLASLALDVHRVVCVCLDTLTQELKSEHILLRFFTNLVADFFALSYEFVLSHDIDDELIALKHLNVGDVTILVDHLGETLLDHLEFFHHVLVELLLLFLIDFVGFFLHELLHVL